MDNEYSQTTKSKPPTIYAPNTMDLDTLVSPAPSDLALSNQDSTDRIEPRKGVKMGFLFPYVVVLAIGMFQYGYLIGEMANISAQWLYSHNSYDAQAVEPTGSFLMKNFQNMCNTSANIAAMIICSISSSLMNYSKLRLILLANILIIVGSGIMCINNYWAIFTGRFFFGAGGGLMTVFVPKFISELSPPEYSGPFGMVNQIMCTIGLLVVPLLSLGSPSKSQQWTEDMKDEFVIKGYWRIIFGFPIVISMIQIFCLLIFFRYESPVDLKKAGKYEQLTTLLSKMYTQDQVQLRARAIAAPAAADANKSSGQIGYKQALFDPDYRRATWIAVFLAFSQPATGINAIMQYSSSLFDLDGSPSSLSPTQASLIIQSVNMIAAISAYPAPLKFGRKSLFLITFTGQAVALCLAAVSNMIDNNTFGLVMVCVYLGFFEWGPGPLMWLYNAEICSGASLSFATTINWLINIIIGLIFPPWYNNYPNSAFFTFAAISIVSTAFVGVFLKETKDLKANELANLYRPKKSGETEPLVESDVAQSEKYDQ